MSTKHLDDARVVAPRATAPTATRPRTRPTKHGSQASESSAQQAAQHREHSVTLPHTLARILGTAALLVMLLTLLPVACNLRIVPTAVSSGTQRLNARESAPPCWRVDPRCDGDDGGPPSGPPSDPPANTPGLPPPPCEQLCLRVKQVYHDPRLQELLVVLSQTPTGRGAVEYLLAMEAKLGRGFISWHDFSGSLLAGTTDSGGFIQLDSSMWGTHFWGRYALEGALMHEAVESYFDVGEGIRQMATRHADYVAQWFYGKFERELHAIPYYRAQDPFFSPVEHGSYGLSFGAWLTTTGDGQMYRGETANCDLHAVDRKGHAWSPSDWLAERGGFWLWGQGTDVRPLPNSMQLSPALLAASDLDTLAQ